MSKKLLIGFAPLLVIASLAVTSVAQAVPHYKKAGAVIAEGSQTATVGWGTLALNSPAGDVSCHNAAAGYVENPKGGGAGAGLTQQFATWDCSQSTGECKTVAGVVETRVHGTSLIGEKSVEPLGSVGTGWASVLEEPEAGLIRSNTATGGAEFETAGKEKVKPQGVVFECYVGGAFAGEIVFYGHSIPKLKNGTTAGKPTKVEFGAGSGELEALGGAVKGTTTGHTTEMGYEEQEVITAE